MNQYRISSLLLRRKQTLPFLILPIEWFDRLLLLHKIEMSRRVCQPHITGPLRPLRRFRSTEEVHRKPNIEWHRTINIIYLLITEFQALCLNVSLEMIDLPPTNDGKDIRRLVHYVCNRN